MKKASIIFFAITFFYSFTVQSVNGDSSVTKGSISEAIKHLKIAKKFKNDTNSFLKHAAISLKNVESIEKEERTNSNEIKDHDLPGAIINIQEAITHAEMGHTDLALRYLNKALNDMH